MNNSALIGYTGFVGGNLLSQNNFEYKYNSKNIASIEDKSFNYVVCAGVSAKKWWANENPNEDKEKIIELIKHLENIKCNKFILISSIDVYNSPINVDETTNIDIDRLDAYGKNRYYLEEFIRNYFDNKLIVRLPALYGKGLKKNFIYDLLNPIPQTIKYNKYLELERVLQPKDFSLLKTLYIIDTLGNYSLNNNIEINKKNDLLEIIKEINFTSINFTDYRSLFQFYSLDNLSKDINKALSNNIELLNISVEPIYAYEIAKKCFNIDFQNEVKDKNPLQYNFKSIYSDLFGGKNGYIYNKLNVFEGIKTFANKEYNYEIRNL